MVRFQVIYAVVFSAFHLCVFLAAGEQTYRIGVLAQRGEAQCMAQWSATGDYLTGAIEGARFEVVPFGFDEIVQGAADRKVDFLIVNPYFYVDLERNHGISRMATLKKQIGDESTTLFGGVLFCRADRADIRGIRDLRNKRFMAVKDTSYGGWLVCLHELLDQGIDPRKDTASLQFGGTHDAVVYAVLDGTVDAGTVRTGTLEALAEEGKIRLEDFKILYGHEEHISFIRHTDNHEAFLVDHYPFAHSSRLYPEWAFARMPSIRDELAEQVLAALLSMPADCPAASNCGSTGWTIPYSYRSVHALLKELRIGPYADYGRITWGAVLWKMRLWLIGGALLGGYLAGTLLWIRRLNRNLVKAVDKGRQMRQGIQKESAKLQAMISNMDEGVVFANTDDIIVEVNPYFTSFFKQSKETLIGQSLWELHQPPVRQRIEALVRGFKQFPDSPPHKLHRTLHGRTLEIRVQPIYQDGAYEGVLMNLIDVTELAEAKAAAESANLQKSQFLSNMSHEIRTPLNGIIGFAEILSEETLTADQAGYVETIKTSGHTLLALINDILDMAKIEAGKLEIEQIPCLLPETLKFVETLMRPRVLDKKLKFEVESAPDLPTCILTDPVRLKQCLINLVNNAIKFTEQGHVLVRARVQSEDGQSFVRFDIEDTGIGIPADKQEVIFQEFMQADGSTTRRFGGTGLGLAITRKLAELLGGNLSLRSEPCVGSVFSLSIPARPTVDQCEPEAPLPLAADTGTVGLNGHRYTGTILVAEDNLSNQKLIRLLLEKRGFEVVTVEDGRAAVDLCGRRSFDLVFMDMQMPILNGYEAAGELRRRGVRVPVIALTAHAVSGDREKCLTAGCDEYLTKPIRQDLLQGLLEKYFASASGLTNQAFHQIASGAKQAAPKTAKAAIPLDDDFRDFNS